MNASDKFEKSVSLEIYCRISLSTFSIAPFCHEEYESAINTRLPACLPLCAKAFEIKWWQQNSDPVVRSNGTDSMSVMEQESDNGLSRKLRIFALK